MFRRDSYWKDLLKENTPKYTGAWIEHWRGWVKLLDELNRTTLTICNVDDAYGNTALPVPAAAVALAMNPNMPANEVLARFFPGIKRETAKI